tara:strand:+ start:385 stop:591 length:207 start_codon:yes stop_codon:yes gene_type:complete
VIKNKKNILIIIFIILGMYLILDFRDHNFKRAVDACLAGSQKLSESKITDLDKARKFCEDQIKQSVKK